MYTIKQASLRSGVGVPLLRAWERRYGVVHPIRTPSGYRLYDDEAIARLRAMRRLVDAGWSPRDAAPQVLAVPPDQLSELDAGQVGDLVPGVPSAEAGRVAREIVQAAAAMRPEAVEALLDEAFASTRFETAMEDVIFPALEAVGAAWARGDLDVGAEHATSAAVLRRLGAAFLAAGGNPDGPTVVVGLPPASRHELAALAFATAARRAGLRVVYLGPDVPVESWLASVRDTGAAAAVLGAVMLRDADAAATVFAALERNAPDVLRVAGGRHADAVSAGPQLVLPDRLSEAVETLRGALRAA